MRIPYFQVNAFTSNLFGGNPAGVCPLDKWLPDNLLQSIAAENDLSETTFFVREKDDFRLRWFTPCVEVDLCGHATLAAAFVLFSELKTVKGRVLFKSRSGDLIAIQRDKAIELDFPSWPAIPCDAPESLIQGLGTSPSEVLRSHRDYMAVFESQEQVAALVPDMKFLGEVDAVGIIATAPGKEADFVSRFFAPKAGIDEDPVTGSAHCSLIPYWAQRLGKTDLFARQISKRGGELMCRYPGERVAIGGEARIYCRGEIEIPDAK